MAGPAGLPHPVAIDPEPTWARSNFRSATISRLSEQQARKPCSSSQVRHRACRSARRGCASSAIEIEHHPQRCSRFFTLSEFFSVDLPFKSQRCLKPRTAFCGISLISLHWYRQEERKSPTAMTQITVTRKMRLILFSARGTASEGDIAIDL
jgi:hypothetical protein